MEYVNNWRDDFKECIEDLEIPKDWEDLSYQHDVCPSFGYKGFQIFINHKDPKKSDDGYEKRFYISRIREYGDPNFEKLANTFEEVIEILDDVNTYHEVAKHFMDKEDRTYKFETGKKLSLDDWIYKNGHALYKDDLKEAHDIMNLFGDD